MSTRQLPLEPSVSQAKRRLCVDLGHVQISQVHWSKPNCSTLITSRSADFNSNLFAPSASMRPVQWGIHTVPARHRITPTLRRELAPMRRSAAICARASTQAMMLASERASISKLDKEELARALKRLGKQAKAPCSAWASLNTRRRHVTTPSAHASIGVCPAADH